MNITKFFIGFIVSSFASLSHAAWEPPIGIPAPDFGIEEIAPAQPSGWPSSAVPGYYFVDMTHINATDIDNPYGYPDKPRASILTSSYSAGSYVEVHGGPYSDRYALNFNCSKAQPCWFRGASQTEMPIFNGRIDIFNSEYIIVENIDINGGSGSPVGINTKINEDAHHIVFRHSNIRNRTYPGGGNAGIGIIPWFSSTISDVVIYNNEINTLGDYQATEDTDFHGVTPSMWGRDPTSLLSRVWVLDNHCYHISGNCVQVNAGNWTDSHDYLKYVYIGRNVSHDGRQGAFGVKQSTHVIISQNTMYSANLVGAQSGDGVGTQYGPDNLWVLFNEVYDTPYGFRQTDTGAGVEDHNTYIIGNLFHNLKEIPDAELAWGSAPGWGVSLWHGNLSRHIVNNTFYNTNGGVLSIFDGPVHLNNNLFDSIRLTTANTAHISIMHAGRTGVSSQDGNVFDIAASFRWWNSELPEHNLARGESFTLQDYVTNYPDQCLNCVENVNPLFVDPDNANFRLQANSPLIDKSSENYVYQRFFDLYGIDIRVDYDGNPRPSGAGWEAGAFEYYDAVNTTPSIISSGFFDATLGSTYSTELKGYGGTLPYRWSLNEGSSLPAGLNLNVDGTVAGTASVSGNFTVKIKLTDQRDVSVIKTLSLSVIESTIEPSPEVLSMTNIVMLDATQDSEYTHTFGATGGTEVYAWSTGVEGNSLPDTLTLSADGVLTGTPSAAGLVTFDVLLGDGESTVTATVSLTIIVPTSAEPILNIATTSLTEAVAGSLYQMNFTAETGIAPYRWWFVTGDFPTGMSLTASGKLIGAPTVVGSYTFSIKVEDNELNTATQEYILNVVEATALNVQPLTINAGTLPVGSVGGAYTAILNAHGGSGFYSWRLIEGELPPGVALTVGGLLTGTPKTKGSFTSLVQVNDSLDSSDTISLTIVIDAANEFAPLMIVSDGLIAIANENFITYLNGSGGNGTYFWQLEGEIPDGLLFSSQEGKLQGKTKILGNYSLTITLTDGVGNSQVKEVEMEVKAKSSTSNQSSGFFGSSVFLSLYLFVSLLFMRCCIYLFKR